MPSEESMIQDLREIEAELRKKEEYRKANIIDLFIKYSTHCKIDKSVITNKINERKFELQQEYIDFDNDVKLNTLQELLGEQKNEM